MNNNIGGNSLVLELMEQNRLLKEEINLIQNQLDSVKSISKSMYAPVHDTDLPTWLRTNLSNNKYIVFSFYNLTPNPFKTLSCGFGLACYHNTISNSVWIMGFDSTKSEVISIDR